MQSSTTSRQEGGADTDCNGLSKQLQDKANTTDCMAGLGWKHSLTTYQLYSLSRITRLKVQHVHDSCIVGVTIDLTLLNVVQWSMFKVSV